MKRPISVFLGALAPDSEASIGILNDRLQTALSGNRQPVQFKVKDELLTLTLSTPDFCFYLSFINYEQQILKEWRELAKNCELPWDMKPINRIRLETIYEQLHRKGWTEYDPFCEIGYTILKEMEDFPGVTVFSIPSMRKPDFLQRIF